MIVFAQRRGQLRRRPAPRRGRRSSRAFGVRPLGARSRPLSGQTAPGEFRSTLKTLRSTSRRSSIVDSGGKIPIPFRLIFVVRRDARTAAVSRGHRRRQQRPPARRSQVTTKRSSTDRPRHRRPQPARDRQRPAWDSDVHTLTPTFSFARHTCRSMPAMSWLLSGALCPRCVPFPGAIAGEGHIRGQGGPLHLVGAGSVVDRGTRTIALQRVDPGCRVRTPDQHVRRRARDQRQVAAGVDLEIEDDLPAPRQRPAGQLEHSRGDRAGPRVLRCHNRQR